MNVLFGAVVVVEIFLDFFFDVGIIELEKICFVVIL